MCCRHCNSWIELLGLRTSKCNLVWNGVCADVVVSMAETSRHKQMLVASRSETGVKQSPLTASEGTSPGTVLTSASRGQSLETTYFQCSSPFSLIWLIFGANWLVLPVLLKVLLNQGRISQSDNRSSNCAVIVIVVLYVLWAELCLLFSLV